MNRCDVFRWGAMVALVLAIAGCASLPTYDPIQWPVEPDPPRVNLTGRWVGFGLYPFGYAPVIYELVQTGAHIEGTGRGSNVFGTATAVAAVEGLVSGDTLFIEGKRFLGEPGPFCLTSGVLRLQDDAMGERLTGEVVRGSQPGACPATAHAHVVLERLTATTEQKMQE